MALKRIEPADLEGKGVLGQPEVPGLAAYDMQYAVEQVVREVVIPALNGNVDQTPTKAEVSAEIDEKVVQIGAGDMAHSEYDPDGRVKQAGGIPAYVDSLLTDKADKVDVDAALENKATLHLATASISGGRLYVQSTKTDDSTDYDVQFTMPAGAFTTVEIDGAVMSGVFDTMAEAVDFEAAPGVPVTLVRQNDRAFWNAGGGAKIVVQNASGQEIDYDYIIMRR